MVSRTEAIALEAPREFLIDLDSAVPSDEAVLADSSQAEPREPHLGFALCVATAGLASIGSLMPLQALGDAIPHTSYVTIDFAVSCLPGQQPQSTNELRGPISGERVVTFICQRPATSQTSEPLDFRLLDSDSPPIESGEYLLEVRAPYTDNPNQPKPWLGRYAILWGSGRITLEGMSHSAEVSVGPNA